MKTLSNSSLLKLLAGYKVEPGTFVIVEQALNKIADRLSKPPEPLMSQEEFDKLSQFKRSILICNMPKCDKVVSTHGLLCVEHILDRK